MVRGLILFCVVSIILSSLLLGCGKKQEALQESQEPLSVDIMSTANAPADMSAQGAALSKEQIAGPASKVAAIPQNIVQPSPIEIQTALKNAGFYMGEVDGKIGPLTKKAIEEFQKANNLAADGKVGPKTWAALGAYLNPATEVPAKRR